MDGVIKLITKTITRNAIGYPVETGTAKEVLCRVESVTRAEYFQAGKAGIAPAFVFVINAAEYSGEVEAEYLGKTYRIYRTYADGSDYLELYAEYRSGVTDGNNKDNSGPAAGGGPADTP